MKIDYNEKELESLMKDFNLLTGMRIVLFDAAYHELIAYPKQHCRFCARMKSQEETKRLCDESDRTSFQTCRRSNKLIIYHCHAGLIEATAPLVDHGIVIGYMMFGQISDCQSRDELTDLLGRNIHFFHGHADEPHIYASDISLKNSEQIQAAAKIMEACTFYVLLKNTISVRRSNFIHNMDRYLITHLSENLSVDAIAASLGVSKTRLYEACALYYGRPIGEHIRTLRLEQAKKLLKETDMPITRISDTVGFADYNYFCRVFKKEVGIPAKKYRQEHAF